MVTRRRSAIPGYMHDFLAEAADQPWAKLLFPPGYRNDYNADESLLTVYSLRGLTFPRRQGQGEVRTSTSTAPACASSTWLPGWPSERCIWATGMPGGIFIDEAWALSTFTTDRRFIERAGRDSRKHNTRVLMASQNPSAPAAAGPGEPRVGGVHRSAHGRAQEDALRFIPGIQPGQS